MELGVENGEDGGGGGGGWGKEVCPVGLLQLIAAGYSFEDQTYRIESSIFFGFFA